MTWELGLLVVRANPIKDESFFAFLCVLAERSKKEGMSGVLNWSTEDDPKLLFVRADDF